MPLSYFAFHFYEKEVKIVTTSANYSNKELLDAILDVRDRTTRIEEKLNRAEKTEEKVDYAKDLAEEAIAMAKANEREIEAIKNNSKWAWGFVATLVVGLIAQFLGFSV
ncbi:hemolysin XhlA family protein [Paenibacillus sp. FSL R7-0302]|uniref:hemolysin XhlA family protein n=1 Tax=Paenibacillus sp. FSL R7-0302 TaxID=2921681 RepID=UPI0030F748D5